MGKAEDNVYSVALDFLFGHASVESFGADCDLAIHYYSLANSFV